MTKTDLIRLNMFGLPVIQTVKDFSELTHVSEYTIYQLSIHSGKYYKTYTIPKKSGKERVISQPSKKLKGLQSWILVNILNKLKVSNSCKGFEIGSSTLSNAEPHRGANSILNIDLLDFFPSVKRKQVFNIYKSIGYNNTISTILTNLCVYDDSIPQGGPCSPKLANLSAWQLDLRIQGFVGKRGIIYTRYADDMSFSGLSPVKIVQIMPMIKKIIEEENFNINPSKTRIAGASRAKVVTGLTLSNNSIGIGTLKYKKVRSKIYHLTLSEEKTNLKLLHETNGWLAYMYSVDLKRYNKLKNYIKDLITKHPDALITKLTIRESDS